MIRRLDEHAAVAGQLSAADLAAAKADGFTTIVNNRPDGEQPGQPTAAALGEAAAALGLRYAAIPVGPAGLGEAEVAAMTQLLAGADGPVLAFCRSGTRSAYLWALARARLGDDGDQLVAAAANAGYDLSSIRPALG